MTAGMDKVKKEKIIKINLLSLGLLKARFGNGLIHNKFKYFLLFLYKLN